MKGMGRKELTFRTRTARITIDYSRCEPVVNETITPRCAFACVKADRWYGRNALRIEGNRPVLSNSNPKEIERLCNECLACEHDCARDGTNCIRIEIDFSGIDLYRNKEGNKTRRY